MKNVFIAAAAAVGFVASPASAATITFDDANGGLDAGDRLYADFDGTNGVFVATPGSGIFATSVPNVAAEPAFGDRGDNFFAVLGGGSATFSFGGPGAGLFSFDLGSADTYNSLTLTFADLTSQTFSGDQLNSIFDANGNQVAGSTNGRVRISSFGNRITTAQFSSTSNSFEFDNLAIGAIPEPGTWALLILGFGAIGGALRRRASEVRSAKAKLHFA